MILLRVIEWAVLGVLLALSVWSVKIMIERSRALREARGKVSLSTLRELILTKNWTDLDSKTSNETSIYTGTLKAARSVESAETTSVERAVKSYLSDRKTQLERGFTALATLGSNAPFIGLFGTVLGIIQAFAALAENEAGSAEVMKGISGALVATAAGLFVAIPAVVAFNVFGRRLRELLTHCESLRDLYLSRR